MHLLFVFFSFAFLCFLFLPLPLLLHHHLLLLLLFLCYCFSHAFFFLILYFSIFLLLCFCFCSSSPSSVHYASLLQQRALERLCVCVFLFDSILLSCAFISILCTFFSATASSSSVNVVVPIVFVSLTFLLLPIVIA